MLVHVSTFRSTLRPSAPTRTCFLVFSLSEELFFSQLGFVNWNYSLLLYSLLEDQPFQNLGFRKTQTLLTLPIELYFVNLLY